MVGGYAESPLSGKELKAIFEYIEMHDEIWEIILSGGDPLILSNRRIQEVLDQLKQINHVRVVRIHTRIPVVDPDRVDDELVEMLSSCGKTVYLVLHANHANEFSESAKSACRKLVDAGIPMRSQTVLLKGVNDTEEALVSLMRTFVINRITPYYLHHLDAAPGTGHFRQSVAKGQELVKRIRGRYSGMCQPTYVLDIPGGFGKSPIGPQYIRADRVRPGAYVVEDYLGTKHSYATDYMVGENS
jgi:lysine 2,3-aminomutase